MVQNRFLDLSLISRFPIYRAFPAIGEIDCPSADAKEYPLPDCLVTQCFFW
jgi:hypothetical protein